MRALCPKTRNYGNMISPTVMFVIEETIRKEVLHPGENAAKGFMDKDHINILALGFSPGVSVDAVLLKCKLLG